MTFVNTSLCSASMTGTAQQGKHDSRYGACPYWMAGPITSRSNQPREITTAEGLPSLHPAKRSCPAAMASQEQPPYDIVPLKRKRNPLVLVGELS